MESGSKIVNSQGLLITRAPQNARTLMALHWFGKHEELITEDLYGSMQIPTKYIMWFFLQLQVVVIHKLSVTATLLDLNSLLVAPWDTGASTATNCMVQPSVNAKNMVHGPGVQYVWVSVGDDIVNYFMAQSGFLASFFITCFINDLHNLLWISKLAGRKGGT